MHKIFAILLLLGLTACGTTSPLVQASLKPTEAAAPTPLRVSAGLEDALACVKESGVLTGKRFAIAINADSTGKEAVGAVGATGKFLPQGGAADYAALAIRKAGGVALDYSEFNTENGIRAFGGPQAVARLTALNNAAPPDAVIATTFQSLDFLEGMNADVRIAGIGPTLNVKGIEVVVSAKMYRPGTREVLEQAFINRRIAYTEAGVGVGRIWGDTLVTGGISFGNQERLQFEASMGPIMLATLNVIRNLPGMPESCQAKIGALENPSHAS